MSRSVVVVANKGVGHGSNDCSRRKSDLVSKMRSGYVSQYQSTLRLTRSHISNTWAVEMVSFSRLTEVPSEGSRRDTLVREVTLTNAALSFPNRSVNCFLVM